MTTLSATATRARSAPVDGLGAVAIVGGLLAVVGGRLVAVRMGLDPLAVGLMFGVALAFVALASHRPDLMRPGFAVSPTGLSIGIGVGLLLAALPLVAASIGGSMHVAGLGRPAAPFLPWAAITILVASAEEGILRGTLFDRLERLGGVGSAVLVTTLAFALMHVPLYGWHVVPLDLAVGFVLAGLKVSMRTIAAPIAAHAVADLATWWL